MRRGNLYIPPFRDLNFKRYCCGYNIIVAIEGDERCSGGFEVIIFIRKGGGDKEALNEALADTDGGFGEVEVITLEDGGIAEFAAAGEVEECLGEGEVGGAGFVDIADFKIVLRTLVAHELAEFDATAEVDLEFRTWGVGELSEEGLEVFLVGSVDIEEGGAEAGAEEKLIGDAVVKGGGALVFAGGEAIFYVAELVPEIGGDGGFVADVEERVGVGGVDIAIEEKAEFFFVSAGLFEFLGEGEAGFAEIEPELGKEVVVGGVEDVVFVVEIELRFIGEDDGEGAGEFAGLFVGVGDGENGGDTKEDLVFFVFFGEEEIAGVGGLEIEGVVEGKAGEEDAGGHVIGGDEIARGTIAGVGGDACDEVKRIVGKGPGVVAVGEIPDFLDVLPDFGGRGGKRFLIRLHEEFHGVGFLVGVFDEYFVFLRRGF